MLSILIAFLLIVAAVAYLESRKADRYFSESEQVTVYVSLSAPGMATFDINRADWLI